MPDKTNTPSPIMYQHFYNQIIINNAKINYVIILNI
jgi:hypothetical protein